METLLFEPEKEENTILHELLAKDDANDNDVDEAYQSDIVSVLEDIDVIEEQESIHELVIRKWDKGKIIIDPDFQRNVVWKLDKSSAFIESIILNYPIPNIYLNQSKDGNYIVVDGKQRLTTLRNFMKNEFRLQNLKTLNNLNGKNFFDLEHFIGYQAKIEDKKLRVFFIKPSVPSDVVHDIFYRINTGGTQLTRQEIRNSLFRGKSTILLKELAEGECFKKATDNGIKPDRMKDREAVLRYFSFKIRDIKDYKSMSDFVEGAMKKINFFDDFKIEKLREDFNRTMDWSFKIFGRNSFRIPTEKTRGTINFAVMESVALFISKQTDSILEKNREIIDNNFKENLLKNKAYLDAVQFATGDIKRVEIRFRLAEEILSENINL